MKHYQFFLALLLFVTTSSVTIAQEKGNVFEDDIRKFEEQDRANMPAEGGIVFVGSSSIRGWRSVGEDYPNRNVMNRGFGGSEFGDIIYFFDRIITNYNPCQVVMYSGDNDIASGKSPEVVFGNFKKIAERLNQTLPETELLVLPIKPSIARWSLWEKMNQTNQLMKEYADQHDHVKYVDIATPMLGEDGKPKPELFIGDGLHFKPEGYALWAEIVEPYLVETKQ